MKSNSPSILVLTAFLPFFFSACGVFFQPDGEIRFGDSDIMTAMNAVDLDSNGHADLVIGISTFSGSAGERTTPLFSTLFLFEETGKTWKYLWKSHPLNRNDPRLETVADEVTAVNVPPDTNDRRIFIRTENAHHQLRYEKGRYLLEPNFDFFDTPAVDRDLREYFRFSFDTPFFFMKGDRQYLFLKRNDSVLEVYRFRPEADPSFLRVGRLSTGPVTAYCVFQDSSRGRIVLCVGGADHRLSFFRVRGL